MARLQFRGATVGNACDGESMRISSFRGNGYRDVGSTEASPRPQAPLPALPDRAVYKECLNRQPGCVLERRPPPGWGPPGPQHITFRRPDFFNGISPAMELSEAFHANFRR